jgi:hypothetical protein
LTLRPQRRTGDDGSRRALFHVRRVVRDSGPKRGGDGIGAGCFGKFEVEAVAVAGAGVGGAGGGFRSVGNSACGGIKRVGRRGSLDCLGGGIGGKGGDIGRAESHESGGGGSSGELRFTCGISGRGP